ncbi:nuclear transcription Y subunit beta [Pancytospora philotis]|nr:nuclear transcription Y subunit beta [Pancytospora philotis]
MGTAREPQQHMMHDLDDEENKTVLKFTDRQLPIANISKIMKRSIPPLAKVSKDSKTTMQRSSSEFIAIVTCRAKEICDLEARKTITGDDMIRAMEDLDMPYYAELARKYYEQYKMMLGECRKSGPCDFDGFENF